MKITLVLAVCVGIASGAPEGHIQRYEDINNFSAKWAQKMTSFHVSEDCQTLSDCSHVTCPERDYVLTCDKTVCSCVQITQHSCIAITDCQNSAPGSNNYCDRDFHCVDGTCRCGHGFGPAPGGGHAPGGGPAPGGK